MPTVKIHIPAGFLVFDKPVLVKEIGKMTEGDVMLYESLPQHRTTASGIGKDYVFVEILVHENMAVHDRKQLMKSIRTAVSEIGELPAVDVHCCIIEYAADERFLEEK